MSSTGQVKRIIALLPLLTVVVLWLAGCAPSFPRELLDRVDRRVTFSELLRDPDHFKGALLMLGGLIVASRNAQDGTDLEMLQGPLDSDGAPRDLDRSEGRFLVHSDKFLDPAVFHPGRLITVIGEVAGHRTMPFGEITYQYPVLDAKSLQLWKPDAGPRFFFGIGVTHSI